MTIPFLFSTAATGDAKRDRNSASACQTTDRSPRQSVDTSVPGGFDNDRNGKLDLTFGTAREMRLSFGDLSGGANIGLPQADAKIVVVGFNTTPTRKGVDFAFARYHRN
jgi:hypothetical protein